MPVTATVGSVIADTRIHITRDTLVRYAGASGDFNPIHYRDDIATAAGLPGVIAHGMLTMGLAIGAVSDALGDPGAVLEYGCRFARPVIVDPVAGVDLDVVATITGIEGDIATLAVAARVGETQVLAKSIARIRLPESHA